MRATMIKNDVKPEVKLVDLDGLKTVLSCGRSTAIQIAENAGASVKIGRRRLYNLAKIQKFLDDIAV